MGIIAVTLAEGEIDFPAKGCRFVVEENIGDKYPIHIHFGKGPAQVNEIEWNIRVHFTYREFYALCEEINHPGFPPRGEPAPLLKIGELGHGER